jgi:hypothetical protein
MLSGDEAASAQAISRAREHLIEFIIGGMLFDLPETKVERGEAS